MRCTLLVLLITLTPGLMTAAEPLCLHVSLSGKDDWSGRLPQPNTARDDGPLASLSGARDAVRGLIAAGLPDGGVEVLVQGGTYTLDAPVAFSTQDSGSEHSRIVYRAVSDQDVRLLGGKLVTNWQQVSDPNIVKRLDESARGQVVQADLKQLGVGEFGSPAGGGIELFFGGQAMTLARWPNDDFMRIKRVLGEREVNVRGTKGCVEGIFEYEGERPRRWIDEPDAWVHGYWFWDWAEQRHGVKSIDPERHVIEVKTPYHNYGYRDKQWFYAFNLLSEIDQPGEWYVDRERGMLYFWPPGPSRRVKLSCRSCRPSWT